MKTLARALSGLLIGLCAGAAHAADITGAGASFPFPVYSKWAEAYKKETGTGLNYQSIGSSGGIKQITARTVTFGASDAPQTEKQLSDAGLVQWPQIMGAVVPAVNLPGVNPGELVLDGKLLAEIYLGAIAKWNDPKIQALNSNLKLPNTAIAPVYRADGSGTSFLFTTYLSQVDPAFKSQVGAGTTVQWPAGIGAKGNEGVANMVRQTQGAVGYVEYAYVKQNKMNFARMVNAAGKVVEPGAESVQAAAASADWSGVPGMGVVLTNQPGDATWPISGASFILMPKEPASAADAKLALDFFRWAFTKGDKLASDLEYVPMPDQVVGMIEQAWKSGIKTN